MSESCVIDEGRTPYTIGVSSRFGRADIARLARYAATSGVAFAVSEATLLILYGLNLTTATVAALIASLAGTVPSYLLSRYWIWREASRERVLRQVILYWIVSISCIALTSLLTGALASFAPAGHPFHLLVVAIGYPIVMLTFWLIKFVIYQQIIFPNASRITGPRGRMDTAAATRSAVETHMAASSWVASVRSLAVSASPGWSSAVPDESVQRDERVAGRLD